MELVQWQMQIIHGLAIHSPESNKSRQWSFMDWVHVASFAGVYTVQYWIHPNQEVDFDGLGVVRVNVFVYIFQ